MSRNNQPAITADSVNELEAELAKQRDLESARRTDELERLIADAEHTRNRADVAEIARQDELDRAEREASLRSSAGLSRFHREALDAGERTRIRAHLTRSGEARALNLERLRTLNLRVLVPALVGFAIWSTTGVQQGAARLMQAGTSTPTWWVLWILEPFLIGVVGWVIVARARLAASGGRLARRAEHIAAACLATSIILNVAAAAWPSTWSYGTAAVLAASALAHVTGPIGAAATAHLIGVIDGSISDADPWTDRGERVPLLADLALAVTPIRQAVEAAPVEAVEVAAPVPLPAAPVVEEEDPDESLTDLFNRSVHAFADDLFGGQVPGIRAIKTGLKVGQPRAQEVQAYLAGIVGK